MNRIVWPSTSSTFKCSLCCISIIQECNSSEISLVHIFNILYIIFFSYLDLTSFCAAITRVCMQWMVTVATKTIPRTPPTSPALLRAMGMVRTPMPMLPFIKWMMVSILEMVLVLPSLSSSSPVSGKYPDLECRMSEVEMVLRWNLSRSLTTLLILWRLLDDKVLFLGVLKETYFTHTPRPIVEFYLGTELLKVSVVSVSDTIVTEDC